MRFTACILALLLCCEASANDAVVKVQRRSAEGNIGHGSGVFVQHECVSFVLTAAHNVSDATSAWVIFPNGQKIFASKYRIDDNGHDVAAMWLMETPSVRPLQLGNEITDDVEVLGYSGPGFPFRTLDAKITNKFDSRLLWSDARVMNANSGGPWLNDNGQVIGITSSGVLEETDDGQLVERRVIDDDGHETKFQEYIGANSPTTELIHDFADRFHTQFCQFGST